MSSRGTLQNLDLQTCTNQVHLNVVLAGLRDEQHHKAMRSRREGQGVLDQAIAATCAVDVYPHLLRNAVGSTTSASSEHGMSAITVGVLLSVRCGL